jgi:hypothetical protein
MWTRIKCATGVFCEPQKRLRNTTIMWFARAEALRVSLMKVLLLAVSIKCKIG